MKQQWTWLVAALCYACAGSDDISGNYGAAHQGPHGAVDVGMTIAADGSGRWEIGGESMPFVWTLHGEVLTIHAREGAVVEGRHEGQSLQVDVPGAGRLRFIRRK